MPQTMHGQRRFGSGRFPESPESGGAIGGSGYAYDEQTVLALNVALASGRPLLVGGPPACGKSSLGLDAAYRLRWRYYQELLAGREEARELCYSRIDTNGRTIGGSRAGGASAGERVLPGVLWWAFDPESAAAQVKTFARSGEGAERPGVYPDGAAGAPAVVLLDEVDRAGPDLPLELLAILEQASFVVPEIAGVIQAVQPPLVIVTTNGERPLPASFTDRCVVLRLSPPSEEKLVRVGAAHFPQAAPALLHRAADALLALSQAHDAPVNTRDYVTLVASGVRLGVAPEESPAWEPIVRSYDAQQTSRERAPLSSAATEVEGVRVFISYAREDAPVAQRLFEDLSRRGHAPWLDQDALLPGQNWRTAIERAIRESALFLALLSERSVSKAGYVQKEMREAIRFLEEMPPDAVYVVPVRLDDCEPPHGPLHDLHWVDLFPSYERGFDRIIRVIELVPRQMKALR